MSADYRVNEIFYSLQGEGFWTGTPMVFVRLGGCNLQCPFCDTDHGRFDALSTDDILEAVLQEGGDCRRICLTGGEPLLQADAALFQAFHRAGYAVHVETNGTIGLPDGADWVTLSPKSDFPGVTGRSDVVLKQADELKLVYTPQTESRIAQWARFPAAWHFLQPCDTGDPAENREILDRTIAYVRTHPAWRLSLQTHKHLNIK